MGRKKEDNREKLFTQSIRTRVTKTVFERLVELSRNTDARSIGEVARKILSSEKITFYHKDKSLNGPMEELAGIRKELKSIGININQITRHFNSSDRETARQYHSLKALEQYSEVDKKVDRLLLLVSEIALKWLQ